MYHRKIENLPITNNAIEGFHRCYESMPQSKKFDVWKFLEAIHRQQALEQFNVAQQKVGRQVVKKAKITAD